MRIITVNVNGIRAAARKGFFTWLARQRADIVCLQEVRASAADLAARAFRPARFHCHYSTAQRPGYSGVALFARTEPQLVEHGFGWADEEARYLEARFADVGVVSLYLPSGTSGDARQAAKMEFLSSFFQHLRRLRGSRREYVICGDFNIAHRPIDLRNWRSNQKNSGFLPEERAWMDDLFDGLGYVDAFRVVDQRPEQYTWWSNRGQAWAKNVGWRIDYQVITPGLRDTVRRARIYTSKRFSDHAPLIIDYELDLR